MGYTVCGTHGKRCCWRCDDCPKCGNYPRLLRGDYCPKCTEYIKSKGGLWSEYRKDYVENAEQLAIDEQARADLRAEEARRAAQTSAPSPRVEMTEAGAQTVVEGTPARTIPTSGIKPKRPQTDKPLALEMVEIDAKQIKLF